MDITIQNKDGVEIQPNGSVNISFENAAVSGDEINVYHVTDDASAVTEVATNTQSFDTNHFSIYVITGEKNVPLTTFNFVANGNIVSTQIVKTGDELITPTAPDVAGKAFVGWYDGETKFEDFNTALTITETTTRTITAKYEDALYVYFYNPAGTQIMRTEKVSDHETHDFTNISYEVDATHKIVGWAAQKNGTTNIAHSITVPTDKTSINVYAIIKEGYWVSFNSDGGSIVDSQFVLHGDNLVLDKSTTPTKPGYRFAGWYNDSGKVENGATVTNPMTLKAHWNAAEVNYTINYWQQKVTDDQNASDAQKTYEYVSAETKKATTGKKISATNSKTYKGFKYNENNSSKDVEIAGDGTTIINVYYDRVLCTVNFWTKPNRRWQITKTVTGLYGANLPEGAWDSSSRWTVEKGGGTECILLTSFDFETAGYADNQGNITTNGVVTTCNFYRQGKSGSALVHYYNEQADGTFKLVQTINTTGNTLNVHEKYVGYELYKYTFDRIPGTSSSYWGKQEDVYDEKRLGDYPVSIASKLKTYSLSYYNYNGVAKTEKNIKYTASLKSYANYTPAKPSDLPEYYVFGGWYKDKACTTKFDFNTEKMPNANVQIYAKWTAKKINLTYNLNTPDGTSKKVNRDVDAGTIASTVLPSATTTSDYSFAGWYYADGNGNITKDAYNVNEAITKDTSVIGKWLYNG
ncbi:InlB B-repeat-containing protein, partial [Holdemanella biformis]|uniref:InlB B-repeat-containing protein n=1 Tax=Holdemanella biformis TaxID=1735 RepID=UPI001C25733D